MKAQRIRIGKANYPAAGKGIIPEAKPSGIRGCSINELNKTGIAEGKKAGGEYFHQRSSGNYYEAPI